MNLPQPYLLFLGDVAHESCAKTGFGIRDWMRDAVVGQLRLPGCTVTTGLPELTPAQAAQQGARAMLLGVAPVGGAIPQPWVPALIAALEAGLDLISGLHTRLGSIPQVSSAAERLGRRLFDVRHSDRSFQPGTGVKREGKRLLTVGTDCALGKKYTALAITRELPRRGRKATFRATGQTGVMISGAGLAIDAVVADFICGAAEWLLPQNDADHWDQPAFAVNIAEVVNAMDRRHSDSKSDRFAFHPFRLAPTSLFKIPESANRDVLTHTGSFDEDDDFVTQYRRESLSGLIFEQVWTGQA